MTYPHHWVSSTFGELNSFQSTVVDPAKYPSERFELYSVPSFPSGSPELVTGRAIGSSKQATQPNDVLVCKINPRINRVWQVGASLGHRQIASSEWIGFRNNALEAGYFRHYFCSTRFRELLNTDLTGVGGSLTRAQPKKVAGYRVPLAPLGEQKRIADKLDALLACAKTCDEHLDRVPAKLKRLRQSVLTAATTGGLTKDWRSQTRAPEWKEADVQTVAQVGTGSTPLRSNREFFARTGTAWITSAATSLPFVTKAEEFVTRSAISAHRLRIYPVGTLLIAMYGEGKTRGQVTELGIPATINQACAAIVVDESKAQTAYVKLALQAKYYEMRELAEGGNQPNLNLSKVKQFPLHLPSLTEQAEIVRRVGALFDLADRIEARYETARAQLDRLAPTLLAKAFRGELVPQDLNDEPASELLSRIRAQRASAAQPHRGRKVTKSA